MCSGDGCEAKHTCYRFTAKPCEHRQTYFTVPPILDGCAVSNEDEGCEYYWNTNKQ